MSEHQNEPERIDADVTPGPEVEGTAAGAPTAGSEMGVAEHDEAVEPDDKAFEVDGPEASAGHA
ncbi:hypothetical protein GCM10023340_10860 [Nocardioides marinquilinus]|uniref:Uncharacterized protein n=1 Tax=Nocardioides marinquilinus TaxID=1210400 RepID=A0ABP9PBU0_9ACTN